jgi:hypothetical protein
MCYGCLKLLNFDYRLLKRVLFGVGNMTLLLLHVKNSFFTLMEICLCCGLDRTIL